MREKLLVVSDWLINSSLKFYSRIAPLLQKGGQLLRRSYVSYKWAFIGISWLVSAQLCKLYCTLGFFGGSQSDVGKSHR